MTDRPPHREWMDLRAYLKTRVAENDVEHLAKFVADTAEPSDPDHAAAIRCAWRLMEGQKSNTRKRDHPEPVIRIGADELGCTCRGSMHPECKR